MNIMKGVIPFFNDTIQSIQKVDVRGVQKIHGPTMKKQTYMYKSH